MKLKESKAVVFLGIALYVAVVGAVGVTAPDPDIVAAVKEDIGHVIRPGGVDGSPFWNGNAVMFMYPPSFDFPELKEADHGYRFEIVDAHGKMHAFETPSPKVPLTNVWDRLPTGFTTVICRGICGPDVKKVTTGTRAFWKSAPYTGNYPCLNTRRQNIEESARKGFEFMLNAPYVRHLAEKGEPDWKFGYYCYPSKMLSAIINLCSAYIRRGGERRNEALAIARAAADWLIAKSEKPGAPLAHFPPTYVGTTRTAKRYLGQIMTIYPGAVANAYLDLYDVSGDKKYLDAAENIAATFLRLQGEDGTWYLKMKTADGSPIGENRLIPIAQQVPMFDTLFRITGKRIYREASDKALAYVERTRVVTWNWEGQFEDQYLTPPYANQTKHDACSTAIYILKRFPGDAGRLALARDLLRFSEDQFVSWERPYEGMGPDADSSSLLFVNAWNVPAVREQYFWDVPIDASAAKLIRTYLALYKAEGKRLDLEKAKTLGYSMARMQWADGGIPTHWCFRETPDSIWINCHISATIALSELADALKAEKK